MVILGIDPGFSITGFSVLQKNNKQVIMLDHGFLRMSSTKSLDVRIEILYKLFLEKILKFSVNVVALETPFLGRNAQTFLKLGYLRGILYLLANQNNLAIQEFAPRQVKQTITGYGGASKEQVANALFMLFPQIPQPLKDDVTDAIAISLCGLWKLENRLASL